MFVLLAIFAVCAAIIFYGSSTPNAETQQALSTADSKDSDGVMLTEKFNLPVLGSAPSKLVKHSIPLSEIRPGCTRQDCIPSIDNPRFVETDTLTNILDAESLGIILHDAQRFYPFPMLETHEIVNDVLPNGQSVAVTYCPLCGTGIVFDRRLDDGTVVEFGVSGMLWQSNLLMYDRAAKVDDRNLWSQVLGKAVVGNRTGEELRVIPSDIITFAQWLEQNPKGMTLNSGTPRDPYNGDYYGTAQYFEPDFDATTSSLAPMTRVHGVIINGQPKAYVSDQLFDGMTDIVAGERLFVERSATEIRFLFSNAENGVAPTIIEDVEGFWFSWSAAHPDTELWTDK